ncbi:MAG: DoxX family protein [Deltaproteobacteria bacterium]|nr:DoxX family protein [Deltaproteobacteria bacterium]
MSETRKNLESVFLLLLRVSLGLTMVIHGWVKIQNFEDTLTKFTNMGLPMPEISLYLAIAGEFLGGLGLIVGLLTPVAAFGVFCTMAVAVFHVHWSNGFLAKDGGFEFPFILMMTALYFIVRGAGCLSLDALFCKNKCKTGQSSSV